MFFNIGYGVYSGGLLVGCYDYYNQALASALASNFSNFIIKPLNIEA